MAGNYGITITQDARQAIVVGNGAVTMSDTATVTKEQAGTISMNGYGIEISEEIHSQALWVSWLTVRIRLADVFCNYGRCHKRYKGKRHRLCRL